MQDKEQKESGHVVYSRIQMNGDDAGARKKKKEIPAHTHG